jgi:hypothetical protein
VVHFSGRWQLDLGFGGWEIDVRMPGVATKDWMVSFLRRWRSSVERRGEESRLLLSRARCRWLNGKRQRLDIAGICSKRRESYTSGDVTGAAKGS